MSSSRNRRGHLPPVHDRLTAYWLNHLQAIVFSLGKLYATPLASTLTVAVIGVALALPTGLIVLLDNVHQLTGGWAQGAQVSVFLRRDVDLATQTQLATTIRAWPEVGYVKTITPAEALAEFKQHSGLHDAVDALEENPLPPVLVITPALAVATSDLRSLSIKLQSLPITEQVSVDLEWLRRLHVITEIAQRVIWFVAGLLGGTVLLVVGNTIRLDVENRRDEVEVGKLIGATNAFIRRPFLYGGIWYGLLGGLLASIIVGFALAWIAEPIAELSILYGVELKLKGLGLTGVATVLGVGFCLGLGGAWLAVGRYLRAADPD